MWGGDNLSTHHVSSAGQSHLLPGSPTPPEGLLMLCFSVFFLSFLPACILGNPELRTWDDIVTVVNVIVDC